MTGYFAKSLAGHDKDEIYIIFAEDDEYVYLIDGRIKTIANPKKKNRKHIQSVFVRNCRELSRHAALVRRKRAINYIKK